MTLTFEIVPDARGTLVRCTIDGVVGAARIDSRGEDAAKARAQAQAEALKAERDAGSD